MNDGLGTLGEAYRNPSPVTTNIPPMLHRVALLSEDLGTNWPEAQKPPLRRKSVSGRLPDRWMDGMDHGLYYLMRERKHAGRQAGREMSYDISQERGRSFSVLIRPEVIIGTFRSDYYLDR